MTTLTLGNAERLAKAAIGAARSKSLNPLSVSVIDASGQLKLMLREDGAASATAEISLSKARAALSFGCTSRQITDALSANALTAASVIASFQGRVALIAGGVLIHDPAGAVIGAIAAAGDAPDNDEAAVLAAIES
jgi:uncharacterized protein GlcG (DUF336 family)